MENVKNLTVAPLVQGFAAICEIRQCYCHIYESPPQTVYQGRCVQIIPPYPTRLWPILKCTPVYVYVMQVGFFLFVFRLIFLIIYFVASSSHLPALNNDTQ